MKWLFKLMLPALVLVSCSKEGGSPEEVAPGSTGREAEIVTHGMIRLGPKLSNPYSLANMGNALASLYPTRSGSVLEPTDLYVRFLPGDEKDFELLSSLGVELFDYPLDYAISVEGDYYHDPSIPEDEVTWQYAVVPPDFDFPPGIAHEVLEECFIPDEDPSFTRGLEDVDWEEVERRSFEASGNGALLRVPTRSKAKPSGRITIKDDRLGKAVGVSCVKMTAQVFVKVSTTYTDAQGNYSFSKKFSARPRYSICFQNSAGFSIGLNLILVPASVSTLGKDDPEGISLTVDPKSDNTLFRRCAVNNAAYDYIRSCGETGITPPPKNLRIWIMNILRPSCSVMLHHGALLDTKLVSNYLDVYKVLIRIFAPDIVVGSKGKGGSYSDLYSCATHEMAHASHFAVVGSSYWNKFATYILSSYLTTGSCYGSGNGENSGYCGVGEMWAYYAEDMFFKDRYGVNPGHGNGSWFHPEVLCALEAGGVTRKDIFSALQPSVTDMDAFRAELAEVCPAKKTLINQAFKKYWK